MALAAGTRLGAYEIVSLLGAGGMGEVYRAKDTKLGRDVALKILPASFTSDPERIARFRREAQVLAALNHPHIAQIYGLDEANGTQFLVLELVDGESLDQRIARGLIPVDEALGIAKQIAEALEAAHEKGIIHRDLKPANIALTKDGNVKVLDFGLAKAVESAGAVDVMNSPTITSPAMMTGVGVILGTAAYMSPEQAKGKSVDKRADIWAFGVVLYELLTGEQPFKGEDVADTLAHVLTKDPDLTKALAGAQVLLRRCLEKDPKRRLRDIGEATFLLDNATEFGIQTTGRRAGWLWPGLAGIFLAIAATLAIVHFREVQPAQSRVRFQISAPEGRTFGAMSLSPDGRKLAFIGHDKDNRGSLWVHSLETGDSRLLTATVTPGAPFWSPDGKFVAFVLEHRLKKIEASGGPPLTICDLPAGNIWGAGAWNTADVIVFGNQSGPMFAVPAGGGIATPVTKLDPARQELSHTGPSFLPDGRHFIYLRRSAVADQSGVYIGTLDAKPEEQSTNSLARTEFLPGSSFLTGSRIGYLLFMREGALMAQPLHLGKIELAGQAVQVTELVTVAGTSYAAFTAGGRAVAFRRTGDNLTSQLTWYDHQGKRLGVVGQPGTFRDLTLSPDGTRVAVDQAGQAASSEIRVLEFARGTNQRFASSSLTVRTAVWSPDASRIVFSSGRDGAGLSYNLYLKNSSGVGTEQLLVSSSATKIADSWSSDGRLLLFTSSVTPNTRSDLWYVTLDGDRTPKPYLTGAANQSQGQFSPDSRWVAYTSDESGGPEIYVSPFPNPSNRVLISNSGGFAPRWRHDGKELLYISRDFNLMAVDIATAPAFTAGIPRMLFATRLWGGIGLNGHRWDVAPDGRLIFDEALESVTAQPVTVILNWMPEPAR